ncbi:MAG: hypothetical protein U1E51_27270, partial [Candidatus Binatia bacterium]|nr:hypothetical protein [Candidatus Binatia bacterium]
MIKVMSYVLTVGSLHFLPGEALRVQEECSCEEARQGCLPSFVFSLEGQIRFRTALRHLAVCEKSQCRKLRRYVLGGMRDKLSWLMDEE